MNSGYKERVGMVVIVRVAMVALVLLCIAPRKLEAETPALAAGDSVLSPAVLSAEDWSAIQANLAQATDYAPLVAGQVVKLTASDAAADDEFGYAVAVSGDTVVVGAWQNNSFGAAYVFERNYDPNNPGTPLADNWGQVQELTASDAAMGDFFGLSVAVSGDTVVVGASGENGGPGDPLLGAGAAY
ncbi:MAG: FG-GAP repeat protein, partial [Anaerolineae bacterium]